VVSFAANTGPLNQDALDQLNFTPGQFWPAA
jgi:hypothetical protein